MKGKYWVLILIGLVLVIGITTATFYPEPWGNDVDANDNSLTGINYANFTGGGYIYSNSTTLILGHS